MIKETIYLFGSGKIFKELFPIIQKDYSVISVADNNSEKWGDTIEGVQIIDPMEIISASDRIFLTVGWGTCVEIILQLEEMGIDKSRIVLPQFSEATGHLHLTSLDGFYELEDRRELHEYDLLCNKDDSGEGTLLFCNFYSVYPINLIQNIKKRNPTLKISLISCNPEYKSDLGEITEHIYFYKTFAELAEILDLLPYYDVFQTLWIERIWALFYQKLRNKCARLNLFVGGSDFYRANSAKLSFKKRLIEVSDCIGVETETVRKDFLSTYPFMKNRTMFVRYGIEYIEQVPMLSPIEKRYKKYRLKPDKIIITCAHNAIPAQRHLEMIRALNMMSQETKDKAEFVFPMTYGDFSYADDIEAELKKTSMDYHVFRDFMEYRDLAEYISISDIYIHVQTTDSLSTTMLEEMYAGAIAVMGSWLPYDALRERGINFVTVGDISDLTEAVANVIENCSEYKEKYSKNSDLIYEMSSWENMSKEWIKAWTV